MHDDRKVLVAGPDGDCAEELGAVLAERGVAVIAVADAGAAIERLAADAILLVVVDESLPPADLAVVARAAFDASIPLISAGTRGSEAELREAMALGARDHILRPIAGDSAADERVLVAIEQGRMQRQRERARTDERVRQIQAKYHELESAHRHQQQCHEESQETYYLDLARMMTIISNIMDGIVFADRNGNVTLMNPTAENLTGVRSFMAIGKAMGTLAGQGELMDAVVADHRRVVEDRDASHVVEVHHSEQDILYIKVNTTRVSDYHGEFAGTLTVLQDVTAEHKTDQLKNQYLSIVAHELRTPLTGIKTFSTMMSKGALGQLNEQQTRVMDSIREQSLRLEHQIDKLINLGYLDSQEYGQDLELFDLDEFVRSAAAPFGRVVSDRSIEMILETPGEGVMLQADRADLRRALQALIENAVKFAPDGSSVTVAAEIGEDGGVEFRVRDHGIGVDPRYHRRIFEKFFQVEDPLTRHHGGAGLGLFVANGILEAHGSQIEVRSELGKGAEFAFRLPKYEGAAEATEAKATVPY